MDYTVNISGVFDKDQLRDWLISNKFFDATHAEDSYYIHNNDNSKVSKWCLIYTDRSNLLKRRIRAKIYNKWLCQVTSGKVKEDFISTHIHYMVRPSDMNLQESLLTTSDTGCSRLEFTVYTEQFPNLALLDGYQSKMLDMCIQSGKFTATPHADIW